MSPTLVPRQTKVKVPGVAAAVGTVVRVEDGKAKVEWWIGRRQFWGEWPVGDLKILARGGPDENVRTRVSYRDQGEETWMAQDVHGVRVSVDANGELVAVEFPGDVFKLGIQRMVGGVPGGDASG